MYYFCNSTAKGPKYGTFLEPSGAVKHSFIEECHRLGQLIYWHKQGNDCIQVRQLNQLRWLLINETLQSVIEKRRPARLFFPHLQYLAKRWQELEAPKKVLELGLEVVQFVIIYNTLTLKVTIVDKNPDITLL